jgi:streptomycin 6-kinase
VGGTDQLAALCQRHALTLVELIPTTISPCVARVQTADEVRQVLKVTADAAEADHEAAALAAWADTGLVPAATRLESCALLLEDLGGETISALGESGVERSQAAGRLLRELRRKAPPTARPLNQLLDLTDRYNDEFGFAPNVLALARRTSARLRMAAGEDWLVHGDFQPNNILVTARGLRVIDPSGWRGPPGFDLAHYAVMVYGDQESALEGLVRGYGEAPAGLADWFAYLAVDRYRISLIPRLNASAHLPFVMPLVERLAAETA